MKQITFLMFILLSLPAAANDRYTVQEKEAMQETLKVLEGEKKKCVVSFIKGYEVYTYPHCTQYNGDKNFCSQYKNSVPTSVVDTAFHICSVSWDKTNQ